MKFIIYLSILLPSWLYSQNSNSIEGYVINKTNNTPLPYVKIYNSSTQKGVLTNTNGYFKLSIKSINDSISLTYIGFKKQSLIIEPNKDIYTIYLTENTNILNEVSVVGKDNSYLFHYLINCKKNRSKTEHEAKAYYELKSTVNGQTIEIVENFYNAIVKGYDLIELNLKAGRFGLQFNENRTFVSLESSRAITNQTLFKQSNFFPKSPLHLSKRELKKYYYIKLNKKYKNDNLDSIYVLKLTSKDTLGESFNSKVWLNPVKNNIQKIELNCLHLTKHPFLPIFPTDTIKNVDLEIVKSFKNIDGKMFLDHIDFNYSIYYKYRQGATYLIKTNAVIHIYDFNSLFYIPKFEFSNHKIGDYRKISALPYNTFFWNNHNELKVSHKNNTNEEFMNRSSTLTNKTVFTKNDYLKIGILENPYITWDEQRVIFRNVILDTLDTNNKKVKTNNPILLSDQYNLSVKIFLDINTYKDSTAVLTSTVFDPYDSYFYLPINKKTNYFINIYFDLIEIERLKLDNLIANSDRSIHTIELLYAESRLRIKVVNDDFFKSVERGNNEKEMALWNTIVYNELGINNFKRFNPYSTKPYSTTY